MSKQKNISQWLDLINIKDSFFLRNNLNKIKNIKDVLQKNIATDNFKNSLKQAISNLEKRKNLFPKIVYPSLPIAERVDEIKEAITKNQVTIIAGETGSGKSTQIPKICLDLGLGLRGFIGHTQPRRLAAISISNRVAAELGYSDKSLIGHKIRFTDKTSKDSLVKVMTDGMLLAEIQNDKNLLQYEVLIIDEVHERSLNIDFLLGFIKKLLVKRSDLKVIITSATLDNQKFVEYFDNAKIIEVSGRGYPVEVRYNEYLDNDLSLQDKILRAINDLSKEKKGDILVFLPTEKDIRETSFFLGKAHLLHTEILPLFSRLSNQDQQRIFKINNTSMRRIILATNVAETSLTVPGIKYVIDSGMVRISRYSYRTKVQRLPIEVISQASANQRAGRCGRLSSGICIRLFSEDNFISQPKYTDPEILRTNLASVILQMLSLKLGAVDEFPFIDMPDSRLVSDGYRLLYELNAITTQKHYSAKITDTGQKIAQFPLDPKIAKMLITANKYNCLQEVLLIASFLSIQNPRERPLDFQQKSDEVHSQDFNQTSDFLAIVTFYKRVSQSLSEMTNKEKRKYFRDNFISFMRYREWMDVYRQTLETVKQFKWQLNTIQASDDNIHKSILSGLLSNIGFNYNKKEYLGARALKFFVFPGSSLFKKSPKWICSAEIVETTKLYARTIAKINPEWLESLAKHLVKRNYSEPFWSRNKQTVLAIEKVNLYGLEIVNDRKVLYAKVDEKIAREIFIRNALVYGELKSNLDFFKHNLSLLEEVEDLEHKSRRHDVVIHDDELFDYYDKVIPENITSLVTLQTWYKNLDKTKQKELYFAKQDLMQHSASNITVEKYPNILEVGITKFPLKYKFEPLAKDDGMTVVVPLGLINQLSPARLEWLVYGFLEEKIIAMMRLLPKNIRKACVPIPSYAKAIMESIDYKKDIDKPFKLVLAQHLIRITGIIFDEHIWDGIKLENHLLMNIEVLDTNNKIITNGRDIFVIKDALQNKKTHIAKEQIKKEKPKNIKKFKKWQFGDIEPIRHIKKYGLDIEVFSCLVASEEGVYLDSKESQTEAIKEHKDALRMLLIIESAEVIKMIKKSLMTNTKLKLLYTLIEKNFSIWQEAIINKVFDISFDLDNNLHIYSESDYRKLVSLHKGELFENAKRLSDLLVKILSEYKLIKVKLDNKKVPIQLLSFYQMLKSDFNKIINKDFLKDTPYQWLQRFPYYLQAFGQRLEKGAFNLNKDKEYFYKIESLEKALDKKIKSKFLDSSHPEVVRIKWLIQELWISWYLQNTKTIEKVSPQRLGKVVSGL